MKTLALSVSLLAAAPAFAGAFQPALFGNVGDLRADIVRVAGPKAPAQTQANPQAQARVWKAEELIVAVKLEFENRFAAFTSAIDAHPEAFPEVPAQIKESFKVLVRKGVEAQKKAVDLGVMQAKDGRLVFALRGQAPSAEQLKSFNDYVEAMAAFDDNPDSDYVLSALGRKLKAGGGPDALPAPLVEPTKNWFGFVQQAPAYTMRAMMSLAQALEQNGGEFHSRWGLEDEDGAPKDGKKS